MSPLSFPYAPQGDKVGQLNLEVHKIPPMTHRTTATAKQSKPRFRFIGELISELKKVVWLTRREALYLTSLVLVVAIIVGIILGLIDLGFTELVDRILLGG